MSANRSETRSRRLREWSDNGLAVVIAVAASLVLTGLVVALTRVSPVVALNSLREGAFGSLDHFGNTVNRATPLLLTGLGVALAFRARLWNIGGEGQFLVGALAASAVGAYDLRNLPAVILVPLLMTAGVLAGGLWGGLAGWLRAARGVPEVISTIMLNFIAAEILSYLVHGPMQEASRAQPATEALPLNAELPILLPGTLLHAGCLIALAAAAVVAVFLFGTRAGFALRAVGANPDAAAVAGIDVARTRITAMFLSGALCGLAGAVDLSGLQGTIYEIYSPGYGFTAVAVALLARLSPYGVVASALFFGALQAGSESMERSAGVSSVVVDVLQGGILLILLGSQGVRWMKTRN